LATYINGNKIGRNDQCPCGSGRKFKYCHGSIEANPQADSEIVPIPESVKEEINRQLRYHQANELQRQQQQGYGRPIISTIHNGLRIVAVGKVLHWSPEWKTFHDFLFYYIKKVLESDDWGNTELKKPFEERHPIIQWYDYLCRYQREFIKQKGKVYSAPMTGAVRAYLSLSYYLYLLAHNTKDISTRLINRLKNQNDFRGAYYEIFVAAMLFNAGFELEFENEDDRSTTHCEFTAIAPKTRRYFSVECKARQYGGQGGEVDPSQSSPALRIGRQLARALKKTAKYERIIFIDVNIPDNLEEKEKADWMTRAVVSIRKMENHKINGVPTEPAYVFVTNHPYTYRLDSTEFRSGILAEGYKIPEFQNGHEFYSIREAVEARERHKEIHNLMESMKHHSEIPSTFDGENPELAFQEKQPSRLVIGEKYLIPDAGGREVTGELEEAIVEEKNASVMGIYRLEDGTRAIYSCPLSEDELRAYRKHPDTFFGVFKQVNRQANTPLEMYDFFYESYNKTSKALLLDFMKAHPDIKILSELPQEELAKIYCERLAYSVFERSKPAES
jgi:hypothetical protein